MKQWIQQSAAMVMQTTYNKLLVENILPDQHLKFGDNKEATGFTFQWQHSGALIWQGLLFSGS